MTSSSRGDRRAFGVSILFHPAAEVGFLKTNPDGTYINPKAEAMYQGYKMAKDSDFARLNRFAPDRYLANGAMHQLREECAPEAAPTEKQIRAVLKVMGGTPA
jgi:hypothetical protein